MISATELELQTLGRDEVLRFNTGDWVEITDDVREFSQRAGEMRQITVNEAARRITFTGALPAEMIPGTFPNSQFPLERNLRVRRVVRVRGRRGRVALLPGGEELLGGLPYLVPARRPGALLDAPAVPVERGHDVVPAVPGASHHRGEHPADYGDLDPLAHDAFPSP